MLDNSPDQITFRSKQPDDLNFIYASWLNSYYYGSRFAERIRKTIFFEYHRQVVERILSHSSTKAVMACSKEEPQAIFGYLIYQDFQKPIIQYLYVKGPFQKLGIGTELIIESGLELENCIFTHWTFDTNWIIDKYPKLTYIPYLL